MIQPIITANQAIANKTMMTSPVAFGKMKEADNTEETSSVSSVTSPVETPEAPSTLATDCSVKGEKLDINFTGCREYSLNGNKVDYFA